MTNFVRKWYLIFTFEQNMILINLKNEITYDCSKSKTCLLFVFYSYILHVQSRIDSFNGYNISDGKKYSNNTETTFETNFNYRSIQINRIPDNEGERKIIFSIITNNTYSIIIFNYIHIHVCICICMSILYIIYYYRL